MQQAKESEGIKIIIIVTQFHLRSLLAALEWENCSFGNNNL